MWHTEKQETETAHNFPLTTTEVLSVVGITNSHRRICYGSLTRSIWSESSKHNMTSVTSFVMLLFIHKERWDPLGERIISCHRQCQCDHVLLASGGTVPVSSCRLYWDPVSFLETSDWCWLLVLGKDTTMTGLITHNGFRWFLVKQQLSVRRLFSFLNAPAQAFLCTRSLLILQMCFVLVLARSWNSCWSGYRSWLLSGSQWEGRKSHLEVINKWRVLCIMNCMNC